MKLNEAPKIIQREKQKYRNWYSKFTGKNLLVFIKNMSLPICRHLF